MQSVYDVLHHACLKSIIIGECCTIFDFIKNKHPRSANYDDIEKAMKIFDKGMNPYEASKLLRFELSELVTHGFLEQIGISGIRYRLKRSK